MNIQFRDLHPLNLGDHLTPDNAGQGVALQRWIDALNDKRRMWLEGKAVLDAQPIETIRDYRPVSTRYDELLCDEYKLRKEIAAWYEAAREDLYSASSRYEGLTLEKIAEVEGMLAEIGYRIDAPIIHCCKHHRRRGAARFCLASNRIR